MKKKRKKRLVKRKNVRPHAGDIVLRLYVMPSTEGEAKKVRALGKKLKLKKTMDEIEDIKGYKYPLLSYNIGWVEKSTGNGYTTPNGKKFEDELKRLNISVKVYSTPFDDSESNLF